MQSFSDIIEYESFAKDSILKRRRDKNLLRKFIFGTDHIEYALGKEWALQLQLNCRDLVHSIYEFFCDEIGEHKTKKIFRDKIVGSISSGGLCDVKDAWNNIIEGRFSPARDPRLAGDPQGFVDLYFRYALASPHHISICTESEQVDSELVAHNLNPDTVRLCFEKLYDIEGEWLDLIKSYIKDETKLRTVLSAEKECSWIYRAALAGSVEIIDPYTGDLAVTKEGIVAYGRGIYRFQSIANRSFFLITGNPWSAAAGLYLPKENIAILFSKSGKKFLSGKTLSNLLTAYFRKQIKIACHADQTPHCHDSKSNSVTIYVPPTDNFAHQIWNFNSFLHRVSSTGARDNIQSVIYSGSEFFGPLSEIHKGLGKEKWLRPRRQNIVSPNDLPGNPLVIPAGGYFIHPSLIKTCTTFASISPKVLLESIEPADVANLSAKVVIWVSLRTRGRAWVPQVESISEVINNVSAVNRDILFLLDGFSRPIGIDNISHKWIDSLQQLSSVASSIITKCDSNVISLIGNSFRESLLWASASHLYVAPYGSSQHKVGWFTGAKGLVYVPKTVKERQVQNSPGLCASPISSSPDIVYCETAGNDSLAHGPKRSFAVSNYDVDLSPELVISWLNVEIARLKSSPPSGNSCGNEWASL